VGECQDLGGSVAASHSSGQFPSLVGDFVKALRGDARFGRGDPGGAYKDPHERSKVTDSARSSSVPNADGSSAAEICRTWLR
jgi:hypothetical protein